MTAAKALFLFFFIILAFDSDAADIIINAGCGSSSYEEYGLWVKSDAKSALTPCPNGSRVTDQPSAYALFRPAVPSPGIYDVYVTWGDWIGGASGSGPNAANVTFNVHGKGDVTVNMDQGTSKCRGRSPDEWIFLCRMEFEAGSSSFVKILNTSNDKCYRKCQGSRCPKQYVNADALKLKYVGPVQVVPPTWGMIKAIYR